MVNSVHMIPFTTELQYMLKMICVLYCTSEIEWSKYTAQLLLSLNVTRGLSGYVSVVYIRVWHIVLITNKVMCLCLCG